jgi:cyclic pyranopterin phosphate synthase
VVAGPLVDGFGRTHRDLRISVTDRCDLRCTYCMPAEGLEWLDRAEILSFEEIERVARLCVARLGVTSIRLTGGEPTVRAGIVDLVARLAGLGVDLALTTNGVRLDSLAAPLAAAGLQRINVSLDTLRRDRFERTTRRDRLDAVLAGIDAAVHAGLDPVKVNCVVVRGVNDDEVVDLAEFGRERGVTVRFIEYMPLDADGRWDRSSVVGQHEIVEAIHRVHPLEPVVRGHQPASRFRFLDGMGEVGVIPSVTAPFCGDCDRIRLTADGELRACLFATGGTDLRPVLRDAGSDDDQLEALVRRVVRDKWAGHGISTVDFVRPGRSMSQIGG